MITRQQVADLRVGDIVQIEGWYGLTVQGPVSDSRTDGSLWLGQHIRLTYADGDTGNWLKSDEAHLVLISRTPRPLYVNHPRTEPVPGDVVRDADDRASATAWAAGHDAAGVQAWRHTALGIWYLRSELPDRLRLLVDGTSGQVVPS